MVKTTSNTLILVIGGTGFLAFHYIAQALQVGFLVRTTVRSAASPPIITKALANAVPPVDTNRLGFVVANLLFDDNWADATAGVRLVFHVALLFPGFDGYALRSLYLAIPKLPYRQR